VKLEEFIKKIAVVGNSEIKDDNDLVYYSKVDGSYLTRVGMEDNLLFLLNTGITEQIQNKGGGKVCNIGFNPNENKWYGWSHRAIYGFGIGSKIKKGDCGFNPASKKDFIKSEIAFWVDNDYCVNGSMQYKETSDGVLISYVYNDDVPNIDIRGTKHELFSEFPHEFGKGEWQAKTIEDAKQMAIDFAESVS